MNRLVILDHQHRGKPSPDDGDRGAGADLDGDGRVEVQEQEADLVENYLGPVTEACAVAGIPTALLVSGTYAERHARAAELARPVGRAAYVACHLNAGGGSYGGVFYDYRSSGGKALAEAIAAELRRLPELSSVDVHATQPGGTWPRPWPCLRGIYDGPAGLSGVLVEPAFLDGGHKPLISGEGARRVGAAIGAGVLKWLQVSGR